MKAKRPRAFNSSLPAPSKPMQRGTPIARGRITPNVKRAKATKEKASGPLARRKFVATLPCAACYVVGYSQGAHVLGNAGIGKKKGPETIAPLCGPRIRPTGVMYIGCHRLFDEHRGEFYIEYPAFHPEFAMADCERRWQAYLRGEAA